MSIAVVLESEEWHHREDALADQPARPAPSPRVRGGRLVAAAVVTLLLVLLALPVRVLGGRTLAQAAPAVGQVYVVKPGDTLASIAARADPAHAAALAARLAAEVGSSVVVPEEHVFIP